MKNPITVKQLGKYLKSIIQTDPFLRKIYIVGEIVNLSVRKYVYFSLKEDDETVSCVYFNNDFPYREGDKVVITGSLNFYARDSKYQIVANSLSLLGEGEDMLKLKRLKEFLASKGYFDPNRKKQIPAHARKIGLITGFESAAYYDFIKVLNDNYYDSNISLYPSLVQGDNAVFDIDNGLRYLDSMGLDLIVLTRGGGSKEDLAVFNNELIANSIFQLNTPIISAIGHEIDTSIADMVSDLRVSTPTKAAELIVSEYRNSLLEIKSHYNSIESNLTYRIQNIENKLESLFLKNKLRNPEKILEKSEFEISKINSSIEKNIFEWIFNREKYIDNINIFINNIYKRFLEENRVYIKDMDNKPKSIDDLLVGSEYILYSDKRTLKIRIEDEYGK